MGCLIFACFMAMVFAIEFPWLWYVYSLCFALAMICMLVEKIQAAQAAKLKSKHEAERKISKELMHYSIRSGQEEYSSQPIKEGLPCKVVVTGQDSLYPPKLMTQRKLMLSTFLARNKSPAPGLLFCTASLRHSSKKTPIPIRTPSRISAPGDNSPSSCGSPKAAGVSTHDSDNSKLSVSIRTLTVARRGRGRSARGATTEGGYC